MKENREKQTIFTQAQFMDAQNAMQVKEKCEKKLAKMKIGYIIAIAQIAVWLFFAVLGSAGVRMPKTLHNMVSDLLVITPIFAYIFGGGMGEIIKIAWRIGKKIGFVGWFLVPFPMDIITGLMLTVWGGLCIPLLLYLLPVVGITLNRKQIKMDLNAANEYLGYSGAVY